MAIPLPRRALAEFVGTAFLLMVVVGSGIAADRLMAEGPALFAHAVITGGGLAAIILAVGPVSGAHLNPAVSVADRLLRGLSTGELAVYSGAQVIGGVFGCVLANLMFTEPAVAIATTVRSGGGLWLGEVLATIGLLVVIFGVVRSGRSGAVAGAVGAYIAAAVIFTSSTSFANPAVAVARMVTDTFTGIAPASVPAFVVAQLMGAVVAVGLVLALYPDAGEVADEIVVPRADVTAAPPPDRPRRLP